MNPDLLYPTLYTPATRPFEALRALVNGEKPDVRRLVICTEDAVRSDDVPAAIANIGRVLAAATAQSRTAVFIRARNVEVLSQLLDLPSIERVRGFVVPKATPKGFPKFADPIMAKSRHFRLMPILEDSRMTDWGFREDLLHVFQELAYTQRIDCLRLGGNDLMGHQGLRRDDHEYTIYDTVVGHLIAAIVNEFRGKGGFVVTAPVFECFGEEYDELFRREVRRSVLNELFGQTAIHPRHLPMLMSMYRVRASDLESARNILGSSLAVHGRDGKMDEKTTHSKWAEMVLLRAELFGTIEAAS